MDITNKWTAMQWLAEYDGRPRPGVLKAAIEGLELARAIDASRGRGVKDLDGALAVLRAAVK